MNFRASNIMTKSKRHVGWFREAMLIRSFKVVLLFICLIAASVSGAQSFPPAWTSSATYAAGDIVQYGGNWYRAMTALSAGEPYPAAAYGKWELNFVRSNTTLTIGSGQAFANLVYAWQFARNARIADAAYLHLEIVTSKAKFAETFPTSFSLDHSFGALISIFADNAANTTLTFSGSTGFTIDSGHVLADLGNLNMTTSNASDTAISANQGSLLYVGPCTIENFGSVVQATNSSYVSLAGGIVATGCLNGLQAYTNSTINANNIELTLGKSAFGTGAGIEAAGNSTVFAEYASIINSLSPSVSNYGVHSYTGSYVDIDSATISNYKIGCYANYARVYATGATINTSSQDDFEVQDGGSVKIDGATYTNVLNEGNTGFIYTS